MEIAVKHSKNAGDIIYTLWAVKKLAEKYNAQITYYQQLNALAQYPGELDHPTKNKTGNMVSFNEYMFNMIKPLIEAQPYIKEFKVWNGERAINLDRIREVILNQGFTDIRVWYGYCFPELTPNLEEKPIQAYNYHLSIKYEILKNAVLVNKTVRYSNQNITYDFLNRLDCPIYFTGTLQEYSLFQDKISKAKYLNVEDFFELACAINACKLFIGNQSMCFAIAEALKKSNRVLEVCPYAPNVTPVGDKAYGVYFQEPFEDLIISIVNE